MTLRRPKMVANGTSTILIFENVGAEMSVFVNSFVVMCTVALICF